MASTRFIATSDITGEEIGTFRSMRAAWAAVSAFDTPARKAAWTKRLTGAHMIAGARAAATKAAMAGASARA